MNHYSTHLTCQGLDHINICIDKSPAVINRVGLDDTIYDVKAPAGWLWQYEIFDSGHQQADWKSKDCVDNAQNHLNPNEKYTLSCHDKVQMIFLKLFWIEHKDSLIYVVAC